MGWFPESYVERAAPSNTANKTAAAAAAPKLPLQSQLSNALEAAKAAGTKSAFTPTHSPNPGPSETQGQVRRLHLKLQTLLQLKRVGLLSGDVQVLIPLPVLFSAGGG